MSNKNKKDYEFTAKHRYSDVSPRKMRPFATMNRGRIAERGWLRTDITGRIVDWDVYFQSSGGSGFVYLNHDYGSTRRQAETTPGQCRGTRGPAVVARACP